MRTADFEAWSKLARISEADPEGGGCAHDWGTRVRWTYRYHGQAPNTCATRQELALAPGSIWLGMFPACGQAPGQSDCTAVRWWHQSSGRTGGHGIAKKKQGTTGCLWSLQGGERQALWGAGCQRRPGTGCGFWPDKAQHKAYFFSKQRVQYRKVLGYLKHEGKGTTGGQERAAFDSHFCWVN